MRKFKTFFSFSIFTLLTFGFTGHVDETAWYENRYIENYAILPVKVLTENVYFQLEDQWFALEDFTTVTGYHYLRRMDHLFIIDEEGEFKTIEAPMGYTVLPVAFEDMDLREDYTLHPLAAEAMIMRAVNYHRFNRQLHSYTRLQSLSLAAIYHSIAQRDRDQHSQTGFNGETHQDRMELWTIQPLRDYVRSSHVSRHQVTGEFTQEEANRIVDTLMTRATADWLMNGYYHYLGVGVGIQENGTLRLTIHMATARSEHARTYHASYVRSNREEAYARHDEAARQWFMKNRYGEENPYR